MRLLQYDVPPSGARAQLGLTTSSDFYRYVKWLYTLPPSVQLIEIDRSNSINAEYFFNYFCKKCRHYAAVHSIFLRDIVYTQTPELLNLIAPRLDIEPIKNIRSVGERGYPTYLKRLKTWRNKLRDKTKHFAVTDWHVLFTETNTISVINDVYDRLFEGITPCTGGLERYINNTCPRKGIDINENLERMNVELPETLLVKYRYNYFYYHKYMQTNAVKYSKFPMNCHPDGRICWGRNLTPPNSRLALTSFWTTRFNYDLGTPDDLKVLGQSSPFFSFDYSQVGYDVPNEVYIDMESQPTAVFLTRTPLENAIYIHSLGDVNPVHLCVVQDFKITGRNEVEYNGKVYRC